MQGNKDEKGSDEESTSDTCFTENAPAESYIRKAERGRAGRMEHGFRAAHRVGEKRTAYMGLSPEQCICGGKAATGSACYSG